MLKGGCLELGSIPTGASVASAPTMCLIGYKWPPTIHHTINLMSIQGSKQGPRGLDAKDNHFGPHNCHTLVGHLTIGTLRARWAIWNQMIFLCCNVLGDREGTKPNLACAAMGTKPPDQRIECVLMLHACQSPSLGKQHSHSASEGNLH